MPAKGRQPFKATVHGEVDGVPFTNYYKYIMTAMANAAEDSRFTLTMLDTLHQYKYDRRAQKWVPLFGAPALLTGT